MLPKDRLDGRTPDARLEELRPELAQLLRELLGEHRKQTRLQETWLPQLRLLARAAAAKQDEPLVELVPKPLQTGSVAATEHFVASVHDPPPLLCEVFGAPWAEPDFAPRPTAAALHTPPDFVPDECALAAELSAVVPVPVKQAWAECVSGESGLTERRSHAVQSQRPRHSRASQMQTTLLSPDPLDCLLQDSPLSFKSERASHVSARAPLESGTRSGEALPEEVPWVVRLSLTLIGMASARSVPGPWRCLYRFFQLVLLPLSLLWSSVGLCLDVFVGAVILNEPGPVQACMAFGIVFAVIPCWAALVREVSSGMTVALMRHVGHRQYSWERSARVCTVWLGAMASFNAVYSFRSLLPVFRGEAAHQLLLQAGNERYESLSLLTMIVFWGRFVSGPFCWLIFSGVSLVLYILSDLHKFCILWYGNAVSEMITDDAPDPDDPTEAMARGEHVITSSLHHASRTYVPVVVWGVGVVTSLIVIVISALLSGAVPGSLIWQTAGVVTWMIFMLLSIAAPMAGVAEVFEYEFFVMLNCPDIVSRSLKWFGPTLLPHIRQLDWGFRVGGQVINIRMGAKVVSALALTSVAALSQQLLARVDAP